jgi:hypothetical protein
VDGHELGGGEPLAQQRFQGEALARVAALHRQPRGLRDGEQLVVLVEQGVRAEGHRLGLALEDVEPDPAAFGHLPRRRLEAQRAPAQVEAAVPERAGEAPVVGEPCAGVGEQLGEALAPGDAPGEAAHRRVEALRRPHEPPASRRSLSASPVSRFEVVKSASGIAERSS